MLRKIAATIAILTLLAITAVVVYAETASVTIIGGVLSMTPADVTLSGVTLNGTDQLSTSAAGTNNWSASDGRGTGAGWNLTIDSTDFADGTKTIDISSADREFKIQLLDANIGVTAGNSPPTSSATSLTAIPEGPAPALKFASAALNQGMGSYTINPNFELEVPAEILAGSYAATITISAVSGP